MLVHWERGKGITLWTTILPTVTRLVYLSSFSVTKNSNYTITPRNSTVDSKVDRFCVQR